MLPLVLSSRNVCPLIAWSMLDRGSLLNLFIAWKAYNENFSRSSDTSWYLIAPALYFSINFVSCWNSLLSRQDSWTHHVQQYCRLMSKDWRFIFLHSRHRAHSFQEPCCPYSQTNSLYNVRFGSPRKCISICTYSILFWRGTQTGRFKMSSASCFGVLKANLD